MKKTKVPGATHNAGSREVQDKRFVEMFLSCHSHVSNSEFLIRAYEEILGRGIDSTVYLDHLTRLYGGYGRSRLLHDFLSSDEYQRVRGNQAMKYFDEGAKRSIIRPVRNYETLEQYQDIWIKGGVEKRGVRECEDRFEIIRSFCSQYKRPFTILDIGANLGYFSLRLTEVFDCTSVAVEGIYGHWIHDVLTRNGNNKVVLLQQVMSLPDLRLMADVEHFDVVLALSVIHHLDGTYQESMDVLQSLGDHLILELPYEENACGVAVVSEIRNAQLPPGTKHLGYGKSHLMNGKREIVVVSKPKQKIAKAYLGCPPKELKLTIRSTFETKELEFHHKPEKREWIRGINLQTYLWFNGVFPDRKSIAGMLESQQLPIEKHRDIQPWNVVLQGDAVELIDADDPTHRSDLPDDIFHAKLVKLLNVEEDAYKNGEFSEPLKLSDDRFMLNRPPNKSRPDVQSLMASADRLAEQGRTDDALGLLEQCFQHYKHLGELHLKYAMCSREMGDDQGFETHVKIALLYDPSSAMVQNELAVNAFRKGFVDEALNLFEYALRLDPSCTVARRNLADLFSLQGKLDNACIQLERVLAGSPDDVETLIALGALHVRSGDYNAAAGCFGHILHIDPTNHSVRELLELVTGQYQTESTEATGVQRSEIHTSIVVTGGDTNQLKSCLDHIRTRSPRDGSIEIVVVNSGGSRQVNLYLEQFALSYPNFVFAGNVESASVAAARNLGARASKGKYIAFVDSAIEVHSGWLDALIHAVETGDAVGIAGGKVLCPDGTIQQAGIEFHLRQVGNGELPWPYHRFAGMDSKYQKANIKEEVKAVTGACLLISRGLFEAVGGFDESYNAHFEDIDLCLKVQQEGKTIIYVPASTVTDHSGNKSPERAQNDRLVMNNAFRFYLKWKTTLSESIDERLATSRAVLWAGLFSNPSGYASEAIHFTLALESHIRLQIHDQTITKSGAFVNELPIHVRESLNRMQGIGIRKEGCIMVSHIPAYSFFRLAEAAYVIGRTMFETDQIPADWVSQCNMMDEIWVPTSFNIETFARSGVRREKLVKIPGSVDVDLFDPNITIPLDFKGKKQFNFLSVFEWTDRKGVDILLKAYFEEFSGDDDVCLFIKTYLVSRSDANDGEKILKLIRKHAESWGMRWGELPEVRIIGDQIPFRELPRLYKSFDALVIPSRGEGWGRPHMEAMTMELPVIATGWSGNTEFMNNENSYLIKSDGLENIDNTEVPIFMGHRWAKPSVKHLRRLMRHVVSHPDEAKAVGKRARQHIVAHYSDAKVAALIVERLKLIEQKISDNNEGEIPTGDTDVGRSPVIKWEGNFFGGGSLAKVNGEICSRLVHHQGSFTCVTSGSGSIHDIPERYRNLANRPNSFFENVDVHVRHSWPPDIRPPKFGRWVVMQPWEFGSLPKEWLESYVSFADEVWAYSNYVKQVYVESGMPADRVHVIPLGFDPEIYHPTVKRFPLKTKKKFKFLFVGGTIYRKGIDVLLKAYVASFTAEDDVCLVIKDHGGESFYKGQTSKQLVESLRQNPDSPEIEYIDNVLTEQDLAGLYRACDVLTHPYRGEGFGLPILEAMACGIPTIVTRGGAAMDFCTDETSLFIKAKRIHSSERRVDALETVGNPWVFDPDVNDLARKMQYAATHADEMKSKGVNAAGYVREGWTWDRTIEFINTRLEKLASQPIIRFDQQNQINVYESQLKDAYRLFAEKRYQDSLQCLLHSPWEGSPHISDEYKNRLRTDAANLTGLNYLALEDLATAKDQFELALNLCPTSSDACSGLGEVFYLSEMDNEAKTMYEHAVVNNPENLAAQRGLRKVNEALGFDPDDNSLLVTKYDAIGQS